MKTYNQCHQSDLGKLSPFFAKRRKNAASSPKPLWQALDVSNMNKKGIIFALLHLALIAYIIFTILSGNESSWPMMWWVFNIVDFPVSLGIYIFALFALFDFPGGPSPLKDISNFWVPAIYFGIVGTAWWYFLATNWSKFIKWIRSK